MSQRLFADRLGPWWRLWKEGERGSGAGEHDGREVLRRLRAASHRTVLRGVRPRLRGDRRGAACQLSFGNRAAGLFFDSRSAAGSLACVTSVCPRGGGSGTRRPALALCAGCNTRKRARSGCWSNCRGSRASWGIYVEQEYHKLARWTNGLFSETNVCSCSK